MSSPPNTLKAVACVYYYTGDGDRRRADYDGNFMVKALKGIAVNGFFDCPMTNGVTKRFTQANIGEFTSLIPRRMFRSIENLVQGEAVLVPIPNSRVTDAASPDFKTLNLAQGIAEASGGRFKVSPNLVFKTAQTPSRDGGSRNPAQLEASYEIVGEVSGQIILVDDVVTTGGHFIGAYHKLNCFDHPVVLASAFGHSTKEQYENPNADHTFDIDVTPLAERMALTAGLLEAFRKI